MKMRIEVVTINADGGEQALGKERQLNQYESSEDAWETQPLPDGPITVGIDGNRENGSVLDSLNLSRV